MSADDYQNRLCAEIERLTQQVVDLRAALNEVYRQTHDPKVERLIEDALAATQPQGVQS